MLWDQISDIILGTALAVLTVFVIIGICEWISRKSLKKVDYQLLCFPIPLAIMTAVYFLFDKLIILNTRPNGSGEPSFPSSHVMVTATIFFMVTTILPHYVKSKTIRIILYILMLILIVLLSFSRVLANMHWPLDVAGALAFAIIFDEIYYLCLLNHRKSKKKTRKQTNE